VGAPWDRAVSYVGSEWGVGPASCALVGVWWEPLSRGSQIWTQETKYTGETFLVIEGEGGVLSRECMWSGGWVLGNSALDVLVSTKGVWGSLICP
jgi:hypothetical protein